MCLLLLNENSLVRIFKSLLICHPSHVQLRVVRSVAVLGGLLQIFLFICLCGISASVWKYLYEPLQDISREKTFKFYLFYTRDQNGMPKTRVRDAFLFLDCSRTPITLSLLAPCTSRNLVHQGMVELAASFLMPVIFMLLTKFVTFVSL